MGPNLIIFPLVALIPMLIGSIWYHPKVFGTAWMKETGMTDEKIKQGNMVKIIGFAYFFALLICIPLLGMAVHQLGIFQLFSTDPGFGEEGAQATKDFATIMGIVGGKHMSFGHGVLHGVLGGLFMALPIVGTNALFEQRSWKYIWIHAGYWIVTFALMGGVLSQFGFKLG